MPTVPVDRQAIPLTNGERGRVPQSTQGRQPNLAVNSRRPLVKPARIG